MKNEGYDMYNLDKFPNRDVTILDLPQCDGTILQFIWEKGHSLTVQSCETEKMPCKRWASYRKLEGNGMIIKTGESWHN